MCSDHHYSSLVPDDTLLGKNLYIHSKNAHIFECGFRVVFQCCKQGLKHSYFDSIIPIQELITSYTVVHRQLTPRSIQTFLKIRDKLPVRHVRNYFGMFDCKVWYTHTYIYTCSHIRVSFYLIV